MDGILRLLPLHMGGLGMSEESARGRQRLADHLATQWREDSAAERLLIDVSLAATVQAASRGLIHELRNRLQVISMVGQTMVESAGDRGLIDRLAPMITGAAGDMEADIDQLERVHSRDASEAESMSVLGAVNDAVRMIERLPTSPALEIHVDADLPAASAGYCDVWHALLNILLNAVEAQHGAEDGAIRIDAAQQERNIEITVQDNGTPVPSHVRAQIFEPFFTTKRIDRHFGIGLTVANMLAKRWHGSLTLVDSAGQGNEFLLVIPAVVRATTELW